MKKSILKFGFLLFSLSLFFACSNSENTPKPDKDGNITIEATFLSAGSLEGEAELVFETKDGEKITFYRNYFNEKEPELDYMFIGDDGLSANPDLIRKVFIIKYKVQPEGKISIVTGKAEQCNQIIEAKIK